MIASDARYTNDGRSTAAARAIAARTRIAFIQRVIRLPGLTSRSSAGALRFRSLYTGADHLAAMPVIVVQGEMLGAPIVPDGERALRPTQAPGEVLVHRMPIDMLQKSLRFGLAPARNPRRVDGIEIKRGATGFRMRDDGRMNLFAEGIFRRCNRRRHKMLDLVEHASRAIRHTGRMHSIEIEKRIAQA